MREPHAQCVRFTQNQDQLVAQSSSFPAQIFIGTTHAIKFAGTWGIGLLLRIESAGLATGLSRHFSFFPPEVRVITLYSPRFS
jgi:hypothetical protein